MNRSLGLLLLLAALATGGCQSYPTDRIAHHEAAFSTWPPDVQADVRAGRIRLGFTEEQVLVALGEPTAKTQASAPGMLSEVWIYNRRAPRLSIGLGGGGFDGRTAVGGAVSASGIKLGQDEEGRVLFHNGLVADFSILVR
jgi:hypothetical protein